MVGGKDGFRRDEDTRREVNDVKKAAGKKGTKVTQAKANKLEGHGKKGKK